MNIIEKIITRHTKDEVKAGEIVWMNVDVRSARDFGGANVVKNFEREFEGGELADSSKTFFTFDCVVPANNIGYAENQHICRKFARKNNVKMFDVDAGIGSHVMIEEKLAMPLKTITGTDSHLNILGAVGALGLGMGDIDIAFSFKTGKTWLKVPASIKINLNGKIKYPTTAKDIVLNIVGKLGLSGALGYAIEFHGDIDALSLDERITISSMATEMGAVIAIFPPNKEILKYYGLEKDKEIQEVFKKDPNAKYEKEFTFDLSKLSPQIALPGQPDNVKDVKEVVGKKIDSVFIGSCTNGRFSDIKLAANILKNKKVDPHVMAKIVPSTKKVYGEMLKAGLLDIFYKAGVIVSNPGCGGCASGQIGMTGTDEVQISTSNRNFKGKQGNGETYLASPVTAAISAIKGEIATL